MRVYLGVGLLAVIGGVIAAWTLRGGADVPLGPSRHRVAAPISPDHIARGVKRAEEPETPQGQNTAHNFVLPDGRPAGAPAPGIDHRARHRFQTFSHVVNGQPVPLEIQQAVGLSAADAAIVQRETAAENTHIATRLRAFIATLADFRHTPDEIANASALELMTWIGQYQPMHLEMSAALQLFDEDASRRFAQERQAWTAFFEPDGLVMQYAQIMHQVRRDTLARIQQAGADTAAVDLLRTRYLLDGHFRLEADTPFDFGRDPGR